MRASGLLDELPGITAVTILGLGFIVLGLGYSWFWVVWVAGFVSLVPITAILSEAIGEADTDEASPADEAEALEVLRERYAAGEIDDAEFERRLDALLGTETVEEARDRVDDGRSERGSADPERERA
ncbi:MAG: SHOCT domain-containing protein [Halobacteriales archaeon]